MIIRVTHIGHRLLSFKAYESSPSLVNYWDIDIKTYDQNFLEILGISLYELILW